MMLDTPMVVGGVRRCFNASVPIQIEGGHCGLALEELPPLARACVD